MLFRNFFVLCDNHTSLGNDLVFLSNVKIFYFLGHLCILDVHNYNLLNYIPCAFHWVFLRVIGKTVWIYSTLSHPFITFMGANILPTLSPCRLVNHTRLFQLIYDQYLANFLHTLSNALSKQTNLKWYILRFFLRTININDVMKILCVFFNVTSQRAWEISKCQVNNYDAASEYIHRRSGQTERQATSV